eukprot:3383741-Prymnesium_polylepis.1
MRGRRVGVENAVPRGRLAAVHGTDGRVGRHHKFGRISSGYDLLQRRTQRTSAGTARNWDANCARRKTQSDTICGP